MSENLLKLFAQNYFSNQFYVYLNILNLWTNILKDLKQ